MNKILSDLSGKIDRRIIDALAAVKSAADSLGISFFVVGATARDLILTHCYGIQTTRMTRDIDLGVEVEDWIHFQQLKDALTATGRMSPAREIHRLLFDSLAIDIVPFGKITIEGGRISWPPEHAVFMGTGGFKEAFDFAVTVRLSTEPELDIKLPTLAGLALMKISSWKDGYPLRKRDAEDLLLIMQKYDEAGNMDRLYTQEQDLLKEEGFDTRDAAIRLLGRDMATMAQHDTLNTVRAILEEETRADSQFRLVGDMIRSMSNQESDSDEVFSQLVKLKQGFIEGLPKSAPPSRI
jgi:predicted nucleotidyltransferase